MRCMGLTWRVGEKEEREGTNDTIRAERQSCLSCPGFGVHPSHRPTGTVCPVQTASVEMLSLPVLLPAAAVRRGGGLGPGWSQAN